MEGSFSGIVKLDNVSDFISTSQNCVVSSDRQAQQKSTPSTKPVKISLQDCLACSGCVTTAETILLETQSTDEFLRKIQQEDIKVAVSISSQSRAALSVEFSLSPIETMRALVAFFRRLGVDFVLDLQPANDLSLSAASAEFNHRFQEHSDQRRLPVLASSCPGWVCYVEKTHGDLLIPYLSKVRSGQATMGKILKSHFCEEKSISPHQLYHCTVMSCFDKKLEASRQSFLVPETQTPEVDSCLTTTEVISLIQSEGLDLKSLKHEEVWLDQPDGDKKKTVELYGLPGSSGGLLEFVFRQASETLFHKVPPPGDLKTTPLRNQNFQEVSLEDENGKCLLKFAFVYGFRNIQTLVRKMKTGKCDYDYVEVMACPFGCLNGGGQPKPTNLSLLQASHNDVERRDPDKSWLVEELKEVDLTARFEKVHKSDSSVLKDW